MRRCGNVGMWECWRRGVIPQLLFDAQHRTFRRHVEKFDATSNSVCVLLAALCAPTRALEREGEGAGSLHLGPRPFSLTCPAACPRPLNPSGKGGGSGGSTSRPFMGAQHRPLRAGMSWAIPGSPLPPASLRDRAEARGPASARPALTVRSASTVDRGRNGEGSPASNSGLTERCSPYGRTLRRPSGT